MTVRHMVDETLIAKDARRLHVDVTDAEVAAMEAIVRQAQSAP